MESLKAALIMIGYPLLCIGGVILYIVIFMVVDEIVGVLKKYTRTWKRGGL